MAAVLLQRRGLRDVGEGRHERFVINVPKFRAKFGEKQARLGM